MKQFALSCLYGVVILAGFYCCTHVAATTGSSRRMWDVALDIYLTAETTESKLCVLGNTIDQDLAGTFTALVSLEEKICTIQNTTNTIDSLIDSIDLEIQTILSKTEILDAEIIQITETTDAIHVNDFGGTWSALEQLNTTICEKFDVVLADITTIESKVDVLDVDNLAQFIATFTQLEALSSDIMTVMSKVESLSTQIDMDLMTIDSLIDAVKADLSTIDSKIDVLDDAIIQDFDGTFTRIEEIFDTLCTAEVKIDQIDVDVTVVYVATYTTFDMAQDNVCTVDSKIDIINSLLTTIKTKVSNIDAKYQ